MSTDRLTPRPVAASGRPRRRRRLLRPESYDETVMPSLRLTRSSQLARRLGWMLGTFLVISTVIVMFSPWQQTVRGTGSVIAFSPADRPQPLQTPIKGRILRFGDNVYENASVKAGDLIAEIQDLDEGYLARLESQSEASESQVESMRRLVSAGERNLDVSKRVVTTLETQLETYRSVKDQMVAGADAAIESAEGKVESLRRKVSAATAGLNQVEADFERQKSLFDENIVSQLKYQESERKFLEAKAKLAGAEADLRAAMADVVGKQRDRDAKADKAQVDIEYATAMLDKARGEVEKVASDVAKSEAELQKAEKDLIAARTKVSRQQNQVILAPFDGTITQIIPNQGGQILKEGDLIATIVPLTADRAVQVWLDGNDASLVEPGRHVRLQFEGWPAVQFAGWPSVAVGTFGGTVVSVDQTDNGKGKFRVLIQEDIGSAQWPKGRYLRQGVRANGWVLLKTVPLWFELWRKMNGFPPVVEEGPKIEGRKPPKLPK